MACRYPGGVLAPEDLWRLVASGTDAIAGIPADRGWDLGLPGDPDPAAEHALQGGFVADVAGFDPAFFGISPREALAMDPQQRLLLEVSWEAVERAGIAPASLRGSRTGVFAGAATSGYAAAMSRGGGGAEVYLMTGNAGSVISGRVAYVLGLEGPAVTVDTACSSALVALHLASQAVRAGECELALAGGVMVMVDPGIFTEFHQMNGLSSDGRCKAFGAAADGMGAGEGAGVVLLERLSDARRNGHPVLAVIKGSAINQDGASNGLTAPNGPSQQRVIRAALASAGLRPQDVDAVEAHGTGTELGDPIEAQAVIAAYGQGRPEGRPLWLGTVKSNIGHTQAAAGAAGVIKTVLALRHGVLPPTLHADQPSPHIDWQAGDVRLLTEPVSWPVNGHPRRAGVSSFGLSGTNAHVILEEAPAAADLGQAPVAADLAEAAAPVIPGALAWQVSARTAEGLAAQAGRLAGFVADRPELDPADVAWSLAATRSVFEHRAVVTGTDREELAAGLTALAAGQPASGVTIGIAPSNARVRVGFLFAGQGSQRAGMGRDLHAASPVFAAACDQACALLEAELGIPVAEVVLGDGADDRADQTMFAQAGLFAVGAGLVALLKACGITPQAVAGHSVGEVTAAYAAGVLSLEDACRLVAARARLMQALPGGGAMTAIAASEAEVAAAIGGVAGVSIAAVNGPSSVVISGDADAVEGVAEKFRTRGRRVRGLRVSHAFHSHRIDTILDELSQVAGGLTHAAPRVPWACGLSGDLVTEPESGYWPRQAREPVRFADAVAALAAQEISVFIEIGPDGTLSALGPAALPGGDEDADFIPVLRPGQAASAAVLAALARAHVRGAGVDWTAVLPAGRRTDLPTYAFQRQRYWPQLSPGQAAGTASAHGSQAALFAVEWVPLPAQDPVEPPVTGRWAVIGTDRPGLARGLAEAGVPARSYPDLAGLAEAAGAGEPAPDGVLAWAGTVALDGTRGGGDDAAAAARVAVARALELVQQWLAEERLSAARLVLVTRGAVAAVPADDATDLAGASVWGLVRSAQAENPDRLVLVDLPAGETAGELGVLVAAGGSGETELVIRGRSVYGRRLTRRGTRPAPPGRAGDRPAGTALVTGGTGMLGGLVAGHLAGTGRAGNVVLASRSGPAAAGAAALAASVAGRGAGVLVTACDTADRAALAGLLARVRAAGPLAMVVHTAGIVDDGVIGSLTPERVDAVMRPKADAAWHLHELTRDADLEAFVLFSSAAAAFGGAGQGNYAAGNAFLDALAACRRAAGLPVVSLAWGLWDGASAISGHLGAADRARIARSGMGALSAGEGLALFDSALSESALSESALSAADAVLLPLHVEGSLLTGQADLDRVPALLRGLVQAPDHRTAEPVRADPAAVLKERLAVAVSEADQNAIVLDLVIPHVAAVLGYGSTAPIKARREFQELGFDSLTAIELRNRLTAATGQRLSATLIFDYPTPALLADHLRLQITRDGVSPAARALDEIGKLERLVRNVDDGDGARADLAIRVRALLAALEGSQDQATADGDLETATAENIFELLDQELGEG